MRSGTAYALFTTLCITLAGCSGAYKSYWKQTNFKETPAPVAAQDVRVVKSRDDLSSEWIELGIYRGKAPTVREAMETAKAQCGQNGANLYVLNVEPFESEGGWKVDGICGRS